MYCRFDGVLPRVNSKDYSSLDVTLLIDYENKCNWQLVFDVLNYTLKETIDGYFRR